MPRTAIGMDIGGSHVSAAAVDLEKNEMIQKSFIKYNVNNHAPANDILQIWAGAVQSVINSVTGAKIEGIGFAMPSPFDYVEGIGLFDKSNQKFENLFNVNIRYEMQRRLNGGEKIPVRFINDATAFAIGEAWLGKGQKCQRLLAITLGTGFGSAFIANGLPVLEGDNIPQYGCLWYLPYNNGIADDFFSTRWFVNRFKKLTGSKVDGVKEIAELAGSVDEAHLLFCEFGENLGAFLAPYLKKFDAEMLIIGGNIAGAFPYFEPAFSEKLKHSGINIKTELSELKENAAIIGSARLVEANFWQNIAEMLKKM